MDIENIKSKIKDIKPYINGWRKMRRSAIIIPIINVDGEVQVLFEVRSKKLNSQPGDICFPGGKIDDGETPKTAALREISEELGVSNIEIINELDTVVRFDGIIIHPFVGVIEDVKEININKDEVDHIFLVPLYYLINHKYLEVSSKIKIDRPKDFPYDLIVNKENYKFREAGYRSLFYKYEDYNIWGITAEMLQDFLDNL
ncbi:NUDIX hydrolase [Clostridium saccharoperbutylacetonicum]|uniref:NUDIX hydrolase n=1 Tax=Clostridium saccharoperbutylacetonicum TaxID=36745 RepID=UPI000983C850|nr:CoA pyrophosphatase [Clostridium saccharoperbutylacetonicum]AQR96644.1 putative nudix hydrolase NudL [Clostridium saccharoperbutylacetonicum]NSB32520.1 8-oxo-dGTP pyrophosphatase MutT (NUDIX family) [Clostridium saccharoperbutylacetonicum]